MPAKKAKLSPLQFATIEVATISDHNATTASVDLWSDSGEVVASATGASKREPFDINDDEIARSLAIGRALEKLGRQLKRDGLRKVQEATKVREAAALKAQAKADAIALKAQAKADAMELVRRILPELFVAND
jgi:hypothetical protein